MITKDVSPAELEIMQIVWKAGKPVTVTEIWQSIKGHDWTYQTVQTFVNRLRMKGYIDVISKRIRSFEYVPCLTRAEYIAESRGMLLDGGKGATVADLIKALKNAGRLNRQDMIQIGELVSKFR